MAENNDQPVEDLLAEKSLWDVFRISWRHGIPWRLVVPTALLWVTMVVYGFSSGVETSAIVGQFRSLLDVGISVVTQILGFLIAGFTIFATLTNPKLLVKMAELENEKANMSWLKSTFSIFVHTFAHYAWFLIAAILLRALSPSQGLVSYVFSLRHWDIGELRHFIAVFSLSFLAAWMLYLAMLVQGFVFNVYHACMLSIAVAKEKLLEEGDDKCNGCDKKCNKNAPN